MISLFSSLLLFIITKIKITINIIITNNPITLPIIKLLSPRSLYRHPASAAGSREPRTLYGTDLRN